MKLHRVILALILVGLAPHPIWGGKLAWRSIGLRGGVNDHRNTEDFEQYEGFIRWNLPWHWKWARSWEMGTHLEANGGMLSGGGTSAVVGSMGPGLYICGFKERVGISMGINPTIISKHEFGDENLGGPIQFTSYIGLNLNFATHYRIGYRLQHMSNGVLYEHNPGLNMHMVEVGYRF